jgi:ribosomal protein S18 acetylase RimI-like enzyme
MATTQTHTHEIRSVTQSDADRAMATLMLAFTSDPLNRWIIPDTDQYLTSWIRPVSAFCSRALEHGTADYSDGFGGVAMWLPPGVHPDENAFVPLLLQTVDEHRHERLFEVFERMSDHEPDEPFWYLLLLGVDPALQRQGIGSALLEHGLRRCDRDHRKAYLVSSNLANNRLYERYGFEVTGTIEVDTAPPMWAMVREPKPQ